MSMGIGNDDPNDQNPTDPAAKAIDDTKEMSIEGPDYAPGTTVADLMGNPKTDERTVSQRIQASTDSLNSKVKEPESASTVAGNLGLTNKRKPGAKMKRF